MSKNSTSYHHHEPVPPLPTVLGPLPLPPRQNGSSHHPLTDLRHTIENFQLSNYSPEPTPLNSRRRSQTTPHQVPYPKVRIEYDGDLRFDSDVSQVSETSEALPRHRLTSSVTSLNSDPNVKYIGKSSQQDKAMQVMGLNGQKSLPSVRRKPIKDDGNIAALEKEFSDVIAPQVLTLGGSSRNSMIRVNGGSVEEDRVKATARDIYNGTELLVALGDAARWLMSSNEFNSKVRTAYMELFDFMGLDILTAVRYFSYL